MLNPISIWHTLRNGFLYCCTIYSNCYSSSEHKMESFIPNYRLPHKDHLIVISQTQASNLRNNKHNWDARFLGKNYIVFGKILSRNVPSSLNCWLIFAKSTRYLCLPDAWKWSSKWNCPKYTACSTEYRGYVQPSPHFSFQGSQQHTSGVTSLSCSAANIAIGFQTRREAQ